MGTDGDGEYRDRHPSDIHDAAFEKKPRNSIFWEDLMKSKLSLVLFCAVLRAGAAVLTVDPESELAADPGAATGVRIPVLAPKFSIRFLREHFEVVITVP